ncbi:RidA family protein [Nocardioides sp.]|uniref:RidA family protein n=1 Tax=Nocardioides sp. TaxID=35761 RepID=UPI0035B217BA
MSSQLEIINPSSFGPALAPYSQAVAANGMLYVAGQVALDNDNNVVAPGDVAAQTAVCIDRIKVILAEKGKDLTSIVSANVWLSDPNDFAAFNEAWGKEFGDHRPARAAVISQLLLPGVVVEIMPLVVL